MQRALITLALISACSFHSPSHEPDAGADSSDAPPIDVAIDAPRPLELIQATSMTATSGSAIYCHGMQLSRDNAWYRVFRFADFGITGVFNVETVHFAAEQSKGAVVTATIYAYEGAIGGSTIDTSKLELLAANAATIPDSDSPEGGLTIPISHQVNANALVAEVSATDTQNTAGIQLTYFHLGANTAGQSGPSYYQSNACGITTPSAQGGSDFILSVEGTY